MHSTSHFFKQLLSFYIVLLMYYYAGKVKRNTIQYNTIQYLLFELQNRLSTAPHQNNTDMGSLSDLMKISQKKLQVRSDKFSG